MLNTSAQNQLQTSGEVLFAVLYARKNSIYKSLPGADVYDFERNALSFDYQLPVIAHPPCRLFGKLKQFSKAPIEEKQLAYHAVDAIRKCGGVLEHPAWSTLWTEKNLPLPGARDEFGGFTLPILQSWFGHKAPKATWLYILGVSPADLPPLPFALGIPSGRISATGSMKVREGTPVDLALYLSEIALSCRSPFTNYSASLLNNKRSFANGLAQC